MSEKLKPCPFCGNDRKPTIRPFEGEAMFQGFVVLCDATGFADAPGRGCGASGAWGEDEQEAAQFWNMRPSGEADG